jgi:hypothetical protein
MRNLAQRAEARNTRERSFHARFTVADAPSAAVNRALRLRP